MCSHARGSASKQWVLRFILVIIYLSLVFLLSVPIASSLILDQEKELMYPYDISKVGGDLKTEQKDDGGSPLLTLELDFPFYNVQYRELYVSKQIRGGDKNVGKTYPSKHTTP